MSTSPSSSVPSSPSSPSGGELGPRSGGEAQLYQRLREHLGYLRLPDAAAALPAVLDTARAQGWSATATLERLLGAEVDATEARRLASRRHFACLPAAYLTFRTSR